MLWSMTLFSQTYIKYCQNWTVIGPGGYTLVQQLHCLLGGMGRLFYVVTHEPINVKNSFGFMIINEHSMLTKLVLFTNLIFSLL